MQKKIILLTIIYFMFGPAFAFAAFSYNSTQFQSTIEKLDMQGHADHDLSNCTVKKVYYEEVLSALNDGKTEQEIIKAYVDEYGQAALRTPDTEGSGLLAWGMPAIGLMVGGFIVGKWIKKLTVRGKSAEQSHDYAEKWESQTDKEIFAQMMDEERRKFY